VRQWRITATADRTAPDPFAYCRGSRREQSLRPSHIVVTSQTVRRLTGESRVGDLFAA